ncbi:hypothetical protein SAMN05216578_10962 [Halopseudomonas formosensis]|uniref:Uncharacterized protein n=1 Tax=Halopseudomonas formosensis TaxID=1002526 RepID=A0A1I6BZE5_9GAMM|nr:hypothetical protein SAMN05216578_10962 [Halopseudomonas formosensis]
MGRLAALQDRSVVAIHHHQGWLHGLQVQLEPAIIRVGLDSAHGHHQALAIRVQAQLVRAHAGHGEVLQVPVTVIGGVDADIPLATGIVIGSGIEAPAILAEHPVAIEVKVFSSFDQRLKSAVHHIDYIEIYTRPAGQDHRMVGARVRQPLWQRSATDMRNSSSPAVLAATMKCSPRASLTELRKRSGDCPGPRP